MATALRIPFTGRQTSCWNRLVPTPSSSSTFITEEVPCAAAAISTLRKRCLRVQGMGKCGQCCCCCCRGGGNIQFRSSVEIRCSLWSSRKRRGNLCAAGSHSDNGGVADSFEERDNDDDDDGDDDEDYVESTVMEAVEVKNESDSFLIKMRDGRYLKCVYDQWKDGYPPDYISRPAMVLKMEDGSDLLLPIIVLEMPSLLLMTALCNVEMSRPSVYHAMKVVIETLGYVVKWVRITKRVHDNYLAELSIVEVGNEKECLKFDLRPSDAINIAVRCKAPIQVNKKLVYADGLKIAEPAKLLPHFYGVLCSKLDRPDDRPCPESEEFVLLRNMLIAAVEERYRDAAQWKELLNQFRSRKRKLV